jgi:hypothetical protein
MALAMIIFNNAAVKMVMARVTLFLHLIAKRLATAKVRVPF